jgi:nicotinamide-nucleotide amidase
VRAAIVAVGSELLSTDRLDTNSLRITERLERRGVALVAKSVIGDDEPGLERELRRRLAQCELVVVTGGLGPTADDVTREAAAAALGLPLLEDPRVWQAIEERFASFGRTPPPNNRKQAEVLEGATVLWNRRGTAPGLRVEAGGATLFLFPGVPHELEALLEHELEPWLAERAGEVAIELATLRTALRPESEVDRALGPAYEEFGRAPITVLASPGEVKIRLSVSGAPAARRTRLDAMRARVAELLGDSVYAEGAEVTLEATVGRLLAERGLLLASAESCTGGMIGERMTRVPGSSGWYAGGVVAYSDRIKTRLLDVPEAAIAAHGAVSEAVARAMAAGARRRLGADLAVAVTGIAGPGGGSPEKPVGTVHLAISGPEEATAHRHARFPGDRERVRVFATMAALELVRRRLLGLPLAFWSGEGRA